jgi:polysaccharide export outer membrane protein
MKQIFSLLLLALIVFSSCGDVKKLQYLQGTIDTARYGTVKYKEPVIQPGDMLSITVFSDNPAASAIYNQSATVSPSGAGNISGSTLPAASGSGYLVDVNGNIQFHGIGNIEARGLTRQQLGNKLAEKLQLVLKNPYCQVRFMNFKITILGEVTHPAVFNVPSEKISVLEAIGLAGDLTPFGRRDSVMIIRETDTERKFGWIDLRKTDVFGSDYFYLQQNDVVIVHPNKQKAASSDQIVVRNIGIVATLLSTTAVIFSLLTR